MKNIVELRDVRPDDKETLRTWRNLPHISKYMFQDHHVTVEEHERWFPAAMADPRRKYWIVSRQNRDIGLVNICDIDASSGRCYGGIYIADKSEQMSGSGVFAEYAMLYQVFEVLKLNKFCGEVMAFNTRACQLHRRLGFQQEGYFREHVRKGDQLVDVYFFAMLRRDWETQRAVIENMLEPLVALLEKRGKSAGVSPNV
ncbi:MAG: UDP-4-amino-4,6-dideoxy-N-acetyl-beta-L-altrosamine N-acetyltransferase [Thermoguttaceae bacterium]|jgi:UDP-4-amino-4,6-dideoxy-N-acetyl-beta-L-altrosamine N-acetyltransferase